MDPFELPEDLSALADDALGALLDPALPLAGHGGKDWGTPTSAWP
ncbi:hypothetical protein ACIQ9P_22210 [Kitasatospora sp. NPDC094019]